MRPLLLNRPNLVLQTLVIGQQIVNGVFAEHTPLEVGGQQSCLIGLEVGTPVGTLVIGLQRGNVGLQLSEVLQSGFQSFDHLLALVEKRLHLGDAFDLCHGHLTAPAHFSISALSILLSNLPSPNLYLG